MLPSEIEVLFVSHKYPPAIGGMEKQSFELINTAALYVKVHTLVYDNSEPIWRFFWRLNRRILSKIKSHPQIRVIHFNDGLIASLASFHRGYEQLKRVVTLHGLDVVFPLTYFQRKIIPRFNCFDQIITVSQATANAAALRGIDPAKIIIIPNGVDPIHSDISDNTAHGKDTADHNQIAFHKQVISPNTSNKGKHPIALHLAKNECSDHKPAPITYFITLGRPVKRKGFSWLMQEVIPALHGNFKLLMVGPFDHTPKWKERLLTLLPTKLSHLISLFLGYPTDQKQMRQLLNAYPKKIQHLGKVPFNQLQDLLAHAQAFLMPNIKVYGDMEGFGLVCLEASMAGTMVVAAELEGITSAITHNCNGLLLPSQDPKAWIRQLQSMIDSPDHYTSLAQEFKKNTAELFSWDIMARAYCQTFIDLCKPKEIMNDLVSVK